MQTTTNKQTENRTRRANNRGALLLTHDGRLYDVPYHGGGLRELYRLINCRYVEAVRLRGPLAGLSIWCDEEGKLCDNHAVNYPASILYRMVGGDYMAGRCVVLADNPTTGDAEPLNQEQRGMVRSVLNYLHMITAMRGERIEATGPTCEIIEL